MKPESCSCPWASELARALWAPASGLAYRRTFQFPDFRGESRTTASFRVKRGLPSVLSAILSAVGLAKTEGLATAEALAKDDARQGGVCRFFAKFGLLAALSTVILGETGCATSGPNHVYLTVESDPAVHDLGPQGRNIARAVAPGERVLGLAYDFNTDHLFLRIFPAQVIRVIERPSGRILREMPLPDNSPVDEVVRTNTGPAALPRSVPEDTAPADIRPDEGRWTDPVRPAGLNRAPRAPSSAATKVAGQTLSGQQTATGREQQGAGNGVHSADLAIRSSDRHLFAVHPDGRSVVELTLFGDVVRRLSLPGLNAPIAGLAFDQRQSRRLALTGTTVAAFAPDGRELGRVTLLAHVHAVTLGYDSDAAKYFVPLAGGSAVGEFDSAGNLVATRQVTPAGRITALDAGPRSFVRVF